MNTIVNLSYLDTLISDNVRLPGCEDYFPVQHMMTHLPTYICRHKNWLTQIGANLAVLDFRYWWRPKQRR